MEKTKTKKKPRPTDGRSQQSSEREPGRPTVTPVNVRMDDRLLARLDKLANIYCLPGRPITRSDALRIATEAGLTVLIDGKWPMKVVNDQGRVLSGAAAFQQLAAMAEGDEEDEKPLKSPLGSAGSARQATSGTAAEPADSETPRR